MTDVNLAYLSSLLVTVWRSDILTKLRFNSVECITGRSRCCIGTSYHFDTSKRQLDSSYIFDIFG